MKDIKDIGFELMNKHVLDIGKTDAFVCEDKLINGNDYGNIYKAIEPITGFEISDLYARYKITFPKSRNAHVKCKLIDVYTMHDGNKIIITTLPKYLKKMIKCSLKIQNSHKYDLTMLKNRYAVFSYYSWGEDEAVKIYDSFDNAWNAICKDVKDETKETKLSHGEDSCYMTVNYDARHERASIIIHYLYDDTALIISLVKLKS